ncbi:MAG: AGE family epimerase/isomerase [Kiritimatiellae bacterium]|nr:AGE family epimerase/isomerase [Kiritimatiellia bacterium]
MTQSEPIILRGAEFENIKTLRLVYEQILLENIDVIIERFLANGDYPFIDTKIDIFTGQDISRIVGGVDIFSRDTVYSWIQSRGIEALCGYSRWIAGLVDISKDKKHYYQENISIIVKRVTNKMEEIRQKNNGMFFWMDIDGGLFSFAEDNRKEVVTLDPSKSSGSDVFHVKAVVAAGVFLNDEALQKEAKNYFAEWIANIRNDNVLSDQQPFDPKNPVDAVPGRRSHAYRMITLGAFALYASSFDDVSYVQDGLEFIQYIIDNHINISGRFDGLEEYDFVEFIDPDGNPFLQDSDIICDPGHALEFVGLGLRFLNVIRDRSDLSKEQKALIDRCDTLLPDILLHTFDLGYNGKAGGICKTFALNRRVPCNSDMPWWNLPETMRAAMFCYNVLKDDGKKAACLDVIMRCSNAFLGNFVNPEVHSMAYQTLDDTGKPIKVIPATPDLDPGYHTGLSIIDFLGAF